MDYMQDSISCPTVNRNRKEQKRVKKSEKEWYQVLVSVPGTTLFIVYLILFFYFMEPYWVQLRLIIRKGKMIVVHPNCHLHRQAVHVYYN